jgi:hypothetical protein
VAPQERQRGPHSRFNWMQMQVSALQHWPSNRRQEHPVKRRGQSSGQLQRASHRMLDSTQGHADVQGPECVH